MKKYVAVWGALFFFVVCVSLYLMMETISTSPGRFPSIDGEALNTFEQKINEIQTDIDRNRKTIDQIRDAVKTLSGGDKKSVDKLKDILDKQNSNLQADVDRLKILRQGQDLNKEKDSSKSGGGAKAGNVIKMEKGQDEAPIGEPVLPGWKKGEYYATLRPEVSVSEDMCTWVDAPKTQAELQNVDGSTQMFDLGRGLLDICTQLYKAFSLVDGVILANQMSSIVEKLKFDNPDGGVWKQGWNVSYIPTQWSAQNKLKVFVVPHSHNDPGWVKTFEEYYRAQTKHILDLMLLKLEQYPRGRFIYAEMSFFQMWWDELDEDKRNRVKKLLDERRLEIVTGGWVMNDEANTHYFAMIDQLLEGHQWLDGTLGVKPQSGWAIDPFGHTPTMAYLLRRSGFNGMLIQRVHYAVKKHLAKTKNLEFMWRQMWDGEGITDMLCHMMPFYSYDVPHTCGPEPAVCCQFDFRRLPGGSYNCPWRIPPVRINEVNVAERTKLLIDQWKKKATLYRTNSLFIPLGDDFRYDKAEEWDEQFTNYFKMFDYLTAHPELGVEANFGTLTDYFNSIHNEYGTRPGQKPGSIQTLSGDFFTYADKDDHYWSGYFTSRPFQKNLDRVMESHLRAAEILFSLATATARRESHSNFPSTQFMDKMIKARRNLGLFQHHDGITGTAKDFVVVDYGNRLLASLRDMKLVIKECATYLTLDTKTAYELSEQAPLYAVDDTRVSHDSMPQKTVLELPDESPRPVMFYNSLAQPRDQVVKVFVDHPLVAVYDEDGKIVVSQLEPFWTKENEISTSKYKVSFKVCVPALGIVRYTIQRSMGNQKNIPASILIFNSDSGSQIKTPHFSIQKMQGSDISLENPYMKASFSGANGMLTSITTKDDGIKHNVKTEFVTYGTSPHSKERSGAYLFLPDGPGKPVPNAHPPVHILQGPVVSEVHVYYELVEHVIRLYNSSGIDGISLDMQNIVDIRTQRNVEMAVRITTDVANSDKYFYTDVNGFQMQKHKTYDKLTLQGNVYPMPTMGFIEDSKKRFSVLSANSLGFSNLKPGVVEVMLDRRLNQDDSRGLGQGVLDSTFTPSRFKILLEKRGRGSYAPERATAFPSLLAHQTSLSLIHPVYVIPKHPETATLPSQTSFKPMQSHLPCDMHLLNLRTMQNRDDGPDRTVPRNTAALFLHRLGTDCSFPNRGLVCDRADGQVILADLFHNYELPAVQQVSLTLMYPEEDIDTSASLDIDPMEIQSYVATIQ